MQIKHIQYSTIQVSLKGNPVSRFCVKYINNIHLSRCRFY